jgi:hypothetical protein
MVAPAVIVGALPGELAEVQLTVAWLSLVLEDAGATIGIDTFSGLELVCTVAVPVCELPLPGFSVQVSLTHWFGVVPVTTALVTEKTTYDEPFGSYLVATAEEPSGAWLVLVPNSLAGAERQVTVPVWLIAVTAP